MTNTDDFEDVEESSRPRKKGAAGGGSGSRAKATEFDCPQCDANNPWPDGFEDKSEVRCHYCGAEFIVRMADGESGRYRLRPL